MVDPRSSLSGCIEFLFVRFPSLANVGHDRLILGVAPQAVVILVSLKPGIIHISERNSALEPDEGMLLVAEQGINSSEPIRSIAIDDLIRAGF